MQGILAGRYRLDRQLGKGGMGSVWLAEHLALNSWVAIKLMDPSIASTVEGAERFKREAQAAASLRSAHVVQVLDYGLHETTPFLVMELLQGQSLADCLEREQRLTPERTLAIMTQVARAIGRAHAGGIVHRDLKPDNIFLVREDDQELAKVLDFGIAKTTGPRFGGMETRTGVTMGTPYYMSPEQVEGKKALDHRSDLWSLAVITCECLTGVRPFDGETFGELLLNICARPVLPPSSQGFYLPGFDEWFAKATNRDTEQRFNSAQEMAVALADVVAGRARPLVPPPALVPVGGATLPMGPQTAAFMVAVPAQTITQSATANALNVRVPMQRRSVLPFALGGLLLLGVGLGLWLEFAGSKHDTEADRAKLADSGSANAAPGAAMPAVSLVLPSAPLADPASTTNLKPTAHLALDNAAAPQAAEPKAVPAAAIAGMPPITLQAAPAPAATAAPRPAAKLERCYADPFTGQIRAAGATHSAGSFACRQNAFTGAYQRQ
jgi:eukaryotic-like serine/threonine-protein kinase